MLFQNTTKRFVVAGSDQMKSMKIVQGCGIDTVDFYDTPSFTNVETMVSYLEKNDNSIILITDDINLEKWGDLLSSYGLDYGKDFIDLLFLKHLPHINTDSKKLLIAYGNCQMHDYYDCLNRCEDFTSKYNSAYFKYNAYPRWKENRIEQLLCVADVFVYTKESFDRKYRDLERFVKNHNPRCNVIAIPCYSFRGVFPQTNPHIQEQNKFDIVQDIFNTFHREDLFVNGLINQGYGVEQIIDQYHSGKSFEIENITHLFDISLKQISMMDRVSKVKIYEFVRDNIKEIRLFKDPVHMEDKLVWFITRQLLFILGCKAPEIDLGGTIHYFTELPIYPEVAETLKLNWWNNNSKCQLRLNEGMLSVRPDEFLRRYYKFCSNVSAIKESLHICAEDQDKIAELFDKR